MNLHRKVLSVVLLLVMATGLAAFVEAQGDPRIRVIRLPKNRGKSFARQRGLDAASEGFESFSLNRSVSKLEPAGAVQKTFS